jgi:hypothetical protein
MPVHAPVFSLDSGYSRVIPHLPSFFLHIICGFKWNSEFSADFHLMCFRFCRISVLAIDDSL